MLKSIATIAFMTAACVTLAASAQAAGAAAKSVDADGQFYATPVQAGTPTDLPGERLIPGASETAVLMDGVMQPLIAPLQR